MSRRWLFRACAISLLILFRIEAKSSPFTAEDILRREDVGRFAMIPGTGHLVFELVPQHREIADFGAIGDVMRRTAAHLYIADLNDASSIRPLFLQTRGAGYWMDGFSPTGKRLFVSRYEDGNLTVGAYELKTQRIVDFPVLPNFPNYEPASVWPNDNEVILTATNRKRAFDFSRVEVAGRLSQEWLKARRGDEPSVSVLTSGAMMAGISPPSLADESLVRIDAQTGNAHTLAKGSFISLSLSPDKRFVAAYRIDGKDLISLGTPVSYGVAGFRLRLYIWDLRDNRAVPVCPKCQIELGSVQWAADSSRVVAFTKQDDQSWHEGRYMWFRPLDGTRGTIEHNGLDLCSQRERGLNWLPEKPVWLAGNLIVAAREQKPGQHAPTFSEHRPFETELGKVDWYAVNAKGKSINLTKLLRRVSPVALGATRHAMYIEADGDIWRIDGRGGIHGITKTRLGKFDAVDANRTTNLSSTFSNVTLPDTNIALASTRDGDRLLNFLDLETDNIRSLKLSDGAELLDVFAEGHAAIQRMNTNQGEAIQLLRLGQPLATVVEINKYLAGLDKPKTQAFRYQYKGNELESCAMLPPDWESGKRYPTVVYVYPGMGTRAGATSCRFSFAYFDPYDMNVLTSHGYIVLYASAPRNLIRTNAGPIDAMAEVVLASVDALVNRGYTDPKRIGLFGFSQGGFAVPWILTKTNRFAAAVSAQGAADYASEYGDMPLTRSVLAEDYFGPHGDVLRFEEPSSDFYLGAPPWDAPSAYVDNSAVFRAGRINSPLMLIQSDMDSFPMGQYNELFTALERQRKDAQLVRYWGEPHGLYSPANIRDMWARTLEWYDSHLCTECRITPAK